MKAVICAAGSGSRLLPLSKKYPKPLVPIGVKTILEYELDNLSNCGISEVILAVGYMAEMIKEKIGNRYKRCNITYVYNKDYLKTQNIYSLWLTRNHIDDGMIFFNGDVLFNQNILKNIITSKHPNSLIVDSQTKLEEDSMKVCTENGRLCEIGKKVSKPANGWAIGIYKLSQETSEAYFKIAGQLFDEGHKNVSFVVPLNILAPKISFIAVSPENYGWAEVDTLQDYEDALKSVDKIIKFTDTSK